MDDKFSITADRSKGLIHIRMSGFYTLHDIDAFVAARIAAHDELGLPPNQHITLNDVREMKVQPQDSVVAFGRMLSDPVYRSRRLAFVTSRSLARAQLGRALIGRSAEMFESVAEAEVFLFASEQWDRGRLRAAG